MSGLAWSGFLQRLFWAVTGSALLAGCTITVPIRPAFEEPPLFPQIRARVGSACKIPIHSADYAESLAGGGIVKTDFDRASLSRFEQVFRSLFTEVTTLPAWPAWRETRPALDGVIELDQAELKMILGDDRRNPDRVAVSYRVCLYMADGAPVNCWESKAELLPGHLFHDSGRNRLA
jgi:hypothetical protein